MLRSRVPLLGLPMPRFWRGGGQPWELERGSGLPLVALAWRCNSWPGVRRGGRRRAASVRRGGRPSELEIAPADETSRWWAPRAQARRP